jgi:outer membrane immunogenic protein
MIKKMIFGFALLGCSLAMPMMYADCCAPQYVSDCCGSRFDGLYVGGDIGVFSNTSHRNDFGGLIVDGSHSSIDTSFTAGVLLGYDWQFCNNKVLGLVADWNWVNTRNRSYDNSFLNRDHNWFTTMRARAGVTVCDTLVYLTGGAVVSKFESQVGGPGLSFDDDETRWGWTGGVGAEFMLGCNWSVGAEFLFLQFSEYKRNISVATQTPRTGSFGFSDSALVGRFIVNYRFGDLFCCN